MGEPTPAIRLTQVHKTFPGGVAAVAGVTLDIAAGEFFSMLGPSGSGKTTVLRMIAGFEEPTSGTIELAGRDVTAVPAYQRDVNTVFQDYALFPHMSIQDNVEYGLLVKKVARKERRERAGAALEQVRLTHVAQRKPGQLSGGQRQRIALARALVNRPTVLLLDEPLGALDLKLREEMQLELKAIQREVGITFLFVTHDQEEALTLSDRIAVFDQGRIQQVGTAREVYEHPANGFVAGFVGTSNRLTGTAALETFGRAGTLSVRPEKMSIRALDPAGRPGAPHTRAVIRDVVYAGPITRFVVDLDNGGTLTVIEQNGHDHDHHDLTRGDAVHILWRAEDVIEIPDAPGSATTEKEKSNA